jgi:hypothetical protein
MRFAPQLLPLSPTQLCAAAMPPYQQVHIVRCIPSAAAAMPPYQQVHIVRCIPSASATAS